MFCLRHHFAMQGILSKYPVAGPTLLRCIAAHMLSGLIPFEAFELIVASLFVQPLPFHTPATISSGDASMDCQFDKSSGISTYFIDRVMECKWSSTRQGCQRCGSTCSVKPPTSYRRSERYRISSTMSATDCFLHLHHLQLQIFHKLIHIHQRIRMMTIKRRVVKIQPRLHLFNQVKFTL
jgi:hypothetical protein